MIKGEYAVVIAHINMGVIGDWSMYTSCLIGRSTDPEHITTTDRNGPKLVARNRIDGFAGSACRVNRKVGLRHARNGMMPRHLAGIQLVSDQSISGCACDNHVINGDNCSG